MEIEQYEQYEHIKQSTLLLPPEDQQQPDGRSELGNGETDAHPTQDEVGQQHVGLESDLEHVEQGDEESGDQVEEHLARLLLCDCGLADVVAQVLGEGEEDEGDDFGVDGVGGHDVLLDLVDDEAGADAEVEEEVDGVVVVEGEEGDAHEAVDADVLLEFIGFCFPLLPVIPFIHSNSKI